MPYRHVNNWIPDAHEWLNGSLVIHLGGWQSGGYFNTFSDKSQQKKQPRKGTKGYQSIRLLDIRGTGISEIVHAPNLKNKIGAGFALILSLRNSGENPNRFNEKNEEKR